MINRIIDTYLGRIEGKILKAKVKVIRCKTRNQVFHKLLFFNIHITLSVFTVIRKTGKNTGLKRILYSAAVRIFALTEENTWNTSPYTMHSIWEHTIIPQKKQSTFPWKYHWYRHPRTRDNPVSNPVSYPVQTRVTAAVTQTKLIWVEMNFFPKMYKVAKPNFSKVRSSLLSKLHDSSVTPLTSKRKRKLRGFYGLFPTSSCHQVP